MMEHYTAEWRTQWYTSCHVFGSPRWRSSFVATSHNVRRVNAMPEQVRYPNSPITHIRSQTSLRIGMSTLQDRSLRICLAFDMFALASKQLRVGRRFDHPSQIQQLTQLTF